MRSRRPSRRVVKVGRTNSAKWRAGRSGDQDNPPTPTHWRMRVMYRGLIRGGHYDERSCEPRKQAEHMAAPTNAALVKKALANSEPSTHGGGSDSTRTSAFGPFLTQAV